MAQRRYLHVDPAIFYRQPISMIAFRFPPLLTLFPTVGAEGGWHITRYQAEESAQFFRKVVGIDASLRYRFQKAANFTSAKAATSNYSLRERFLSGTEPVVADSLNSVPELGMHSGEPNAGQDGFSFSSQFALSGKRYGIIRG
jgi:hypothetical protein